MREIGERKMRRERGRVGSKECEMPLRTERERKGERKRDRRREIKMKT